MVPSIEEAYSGGQCLITSEEIGKCTMTLPDYPTFWKPGDKIKIYIVNERLEAESGTEH